jgi:lipopolysaccharide/colanic/teichoic acid biosynthesis glycosyltransferase
MGKQGSFIKRLTDICISIFVLIITSPVILIAAIAVKLDTPGPAFFIHERTGLGGKNFRMYKFRGMIDNALAHGPVLTQVNDPRLTRAGKFLRRTSIDEIPQFINVLKGEMSVVGPRPEMVQLTKDYSDEDREVFNFKPGITGYSQVNGRQKLTSSERSKMEIEYYSHATFWSDFKIIIKTFSVVLTNEGNI